MTFFSTAERIVDRRRAVHRRRPRSRRGAMRWRTIARVATHFELDVRQYETVERLTHRSAGDGEAVRRAVAHASARTRREARERVRARWSSRRLLRIAPIGSACPARPAARAPRYRDGHEALQRDRRGRGRRQLRRGGGARYVAPRRAGDARALRRRRSTEDQAVGAARTSRRGFARGASPRASARA